EAFEAYMRGRSEWAKRNPLSLQQSVAHFEEALRREPNYALAWAALANTYALLGSSPYDMLPAHEAVPQAKEAARQALALDQALADAHHALAHALLFYDWDWKGAEREFQHAIEQNPGYATARQWYAEYLWVTGRTEEALGQLQQALGYDPHSIVVQLAIGRHYYLTRQYEQALALYRDAIGDEPSLFLGHLHLGLALVQTGQHEEALAALERAVELFPGSPLCLAALGHAQARAGQEEQARAVAAQLEQMASQRPVQALYIAGVYAGLGDNERAFGWLERAYQERSTYVIFLGIEPIFDPVRDDPRFGQLIGRIGLPAPD
ncbi:MAG: tetratricopeptide repeat protein, partial [Terriglobia bacterium]